MDKKELIECPGCHDFGGTEEQIKKHWHECEYKQDVDCSSCHYETFALHYFYDRLAQNDEGWLCEICYSTLIGNAYKYPTRYENTPLMRSVAYIGNMILDEIRKRD